MILVPHPPLLYKLFFFKYTATTEIYTLSLHDALPILFDIQGQIEELDGRLRYLHDQADMSTITMLLAQPAAAHHKAGHATAIGSALRRSWQRATDVVTAVIVGAGVVIPVALLALVALLAARWLLPAVRGRTSHAIETPAPE